MTVCGPLPRCGGSPSGFGRQMTAPTLGPRVGPNGGGSHSVRLPLGLTGNGVPKHYSIPSTDVYRRSARGGLGTTFGPRFGSPVKPRFPEPHTYTARAFSVKPLASPNIYKEPVQPAWKMGRPDSRMSRSSSSLSMASSTSSLQLPGRTSPEQWGPGPLENVIMRRSYTPDTSFQGFGRPRAVRPGTSNSLITSPSLGSLPSPSRFGDDF